MTSQHKPECLIAWWWVILLVAGLGWSSLISAGATPILPAINTNFIVTVTNSTYGALGDNATDNTSAIQSAITAASHGGLTNGLLGGSVRIPAGTNAYLCGPLTLANNVNFQIDGGAILRLLPYDSYPGGITSPANFISGSSLTNIAISGPGAIDGQGAPWWPGYKTNSRPVIVSFSKCSRVLIQTLTISNPPCQHMSIKGSGGNVTIQGLTELAPDSITGNPLSHNTDGIDLAETNCLVQNCNLSVGDDNIAIGSSAGLSRDIVVTNCIFGNGHGVSIGSYTSSGVSNLTVINCTFNGTQNGIRLKSDNDRAGLVQNLSYLNLGMTNVNMPFVIYSYYNSSISPNNVAAMQAATQAVDTVVSTTPIWRNLLFSNINGTASSGNPAGAVWSRTELPATNFIFSHVNFTAYDTFNLFNVSGVQFIDSHFYLPANISTFTLFNAQITVSNSMPGASQVSFDGLTTNGYGNSFVFANAPATAANTNVIANGPVTLIGSILTVSNSFILTPTTVLNFWPGTNAAKLAVVGNLTLGGTNNIAAGAGFTNGTYTLMSCTGTLNGSLPNLGLLPATSHATLFNLITNTSRQINLVVAAPAAPLINNVHLVSQTNLVLTGTGGNTNFNCYVLFTTNLTQTPAIWTRLATNSFQPNGTFSFTNAITTSAPRRFYLLQYP